MSKKQAAELISKELEKIPPWKHKREEHTRHNLINEQKPGPGYSEDINPNAKLHQITQARKEAAFMYWHWTHYEVG